MISWASSRLRCVIVALPNRKSCSFKEIHLREGGKAHGNIVSASGGLRNPPAVVWQRSRHIRVQYQKSTAN